MPPTPITLATHSPAQTPYDNHILTPLNDHVIRISTMTAPFPWHAHPNSDETFLVIEGTLALDFDDGTVTLHPGQLLTVPAGTRHRTRPLTPRSVNLTVERANTLTDPLPAPTP